MILHDKLPVTRQRLLYCFLPEPKVILLNLLLLILSTSAMLIYLHLSQCAIVLGVSLVIKRYSMIGDGLSHVGFSSLSVAMALNGKTIRWEGIYTESTNLQTDESYKFVIRYGPGCCGNDGVAGFEILYDGESTPNPDDWVEAVGKIEMIEENGAEYVAIRLSELNVLDERGQEFVSN